MKNNVEKEIKNLEKQIRNLISLRKEKIQILQNLFKISKTPKGESGLS